MRKNELRKIIADGKTVLNAWLAIANPFSAELMAHQGFDAVMSVIKVFETASRANGGRLWLVWLMTLRGSALVLQAA
jgi:hypothetical protein